MSTKKIYRIRRPDPELFPDDSIPWVNSFDEAMWHVYVSLCYAERELEHLKDTDLANGRVHPSFVKDLIGLESSFEGMGATITETYEKWHKAIKEHQKRASRARG